MIAFGQYFSYIYHHFLFKYIQENSWKISGGFVKILRSFICEDMFENWLNVELRNIRVWLLSHGIHSLSNFQFYNGADFFNKNSIIAPSVFYQVQVVPIENNHVLLAIKICIDFKLDRWKKKYFPFKIWSFLKAVIKSCSEKMLPKKNLS